MEKSNEKTILNAAAEIFAEKGFSGARINEIASKAGVNKVMLYYRVGDKQELYRRVVLRAQQGFQRALIEAVESSATAPETIASILSGIAENASRDRLVPSIILRELAGSARTLPEDCKDGIRSFLGIVKSMVTMGVEEGSFRCIDPVALLFLVMGAVFTLSLTAEMRQELNPERPGPVKPEQITSALLDIISHGILKEGSVQ